MAQKHVRKGTVTMGYVHMDAVEEPFGRSLALTLGYRGTAINSTAPIIAASNPRQEMARNAVIDLFLESSSEWLMWVDTDMSWEHTAVERLLATAKKHKADAVAGLGFVYKRRSNELVPNGWLWNGEDWEDQLNYQMNHVQEIDATGTGFVLVNRTLFEEFPRHGEWHQTWTHHPVHDRPMGHDLAFFFEATQTMGKKLVWDTNVKTAHIKRFELTEETYMDYLKGRGNASS